MVCCPGSHEFKLECILFFKSASPSLWGGECSSSLGATFPTASQPCAETKIKKTKLLFGLLELGYAGNPLEKRQRSCRKEILKQPNTLKYILVRYYIQRDTHNLNGLTSLTWLLPSLKET